MYIITDCCKVQAAYPGKGAFYYACPKCGKGATVTKVENLPKEDEPEKKE